MSAAHCPEYAFVCQQRCGRGARKVGPLAMILAARVILVNMHLLRHASFSSQRSRKAFCLSSDALNELSIPREAGRPPVLCAYSSWCYACHQLSQWAHRVQSRNTCGSFSIDCQTSMETAFCVSVYAPHSQIECETSPFPSLR